MCICVCMWSLPHQAHVDSVKAFQKRCCDIRYKMFEIVDIRGVEGCACPNTTPYSKFQLRFVQVTPPVRAMQVKMK